MGSLMVICDRLSQTFADFTDVFSKSKNNIAQFRNELLRKIDGQVPEIQLKFDVWNSAEEKYLSKMKRAMTLGKEFLSLATTLGLKESMTMMMSRQKAMSMVKKARNDR